MTTTSFSLQGKEYTRAIDIIYKEGTFLTTDGSSYFLFHKDGLFNSGPLSLSGQEIRGKWTRQGDSQFIVEGEWSWVNGVSVLNDRRRLIMTVHPPCSLEDGSKYPFIPQVGGQRPKIYKCYFTIDKLMKLNDKR